jgi:hypothetical protein
MAQGEEVSEARWTELIGYGWQQVLHSLQDEGFRTRFLSEENFECVKRIQQDLGVPPIDVFLLCVSSGPSGNWKAPAPSEIKADTEWLSDEVLPRLRRIARYTSRPLSPYGVLVRGGPPPRLRRSPESLPRSPDKIPRALVGGRMPLVFPPRLTTTFETLEELVSVLKERGNTLASPPRRERNEAERYFLERWEERSLRLRQIARWLRARADAVREDREAEETRIGEGPLTREWERLKRREDLARKQLLEFEQVEETEEHKLRLRSEHGRALFEVIFGSELDEEAYRKRLAEISLPEKRGKPP